MAEDPDVSNRMFAALADGLWSPEQAALGAPYVVPYLEAAPAIAARRGPGFANVVGASFPRMRLDDAQLDGSARPSRVRCPRCCGGSGRTSSTTVIAACR